MGCSCFLPWLLLSSVLLGVSSSHGFGRKMMVTMKMEDSAKTSLLEGTGGKSRELIGLKDYNNPLPNENHASGIPHLPPRLCC